MTNEQLKQIGEAMIAHSEGRPIQFSINGSNWYDTAIPNWLSAAMSYRAKPEPAMRPWNCPADVPIGVVYIRSIGFEEGFSVLLSAGKRGIEISTYTHENAVIEWNDTDKFEHSTDRVTWLPCTVPA